MGRPFNIFVDSDQTLDEFAKELEYLLGIKLQYTVDEGEVYYKSYDNQKLITVGSHNFENDRDLKFEDYSYDIAIEVFGVKVEQPSHANIQFCNFLFEKLKKTQKYPLMMVDDLQVKLHEFNPDR